MGNAAGILFSLGALACWGLGDFFIQKSARMFGSWRTLLYNTFISGVLLAPFVIRELPALLAQSRDLLMLVLLTVIILFTALFDFEALKRGKISVVEPLMGIELPITVGLSIFVANERLHWTQLVLIGVVFLGIVLAVTQRHTNLHFHRRIFEKGVILAGVGALCMALMNIFVGVSSRQISPLMTLWFTDVLLFVICILYLVLRERGTRLVSDFRKHTKLVLAQGFLDNAAWVFYAYAMTMIPIAIATAVSESYIAFAVLLGLFVGREKLQTHQLVGVCLAVSGVIFLSLAELR